MSQTGRDGPHADAAWQRQSDHWNSAYRREQARPECQLEVEDATTPWTQLPVQSRSSSARASRIFLHIQIAWLLHSSISSPHLCKCAFQPSQSQEASIPWPLWQLLPRVSVTPDCLYQLGRNSMALPMHTTAFQPAPGVLQAGRAVSESSRLRLWLSEVGLEAICVRKAPSWRDAAG